MEPVPYDLIALLRDITAIILLLRCFSLFVLTIAGRDLSNKAIVQAGCLLVIAILGAVLSDARGFFLGRWPAVIMILLTVGFWALVRRAKSRAY